jgi:hypothetical protein
MLVPVSMTFQWAAEIQKFSGELLKGKDIFIAKKVVRILCGVFVCVCLFMCVCVCVCVCE